MGDNSWEDMPNFVSRNTITAIADNLAKVSASQSKPFAVVLHGGEPLLIGVRRLENLFQELRAVLPEKHPIGIQSNGMLISEPILDICAKYKVSISVSLDGPQEVNDVSRVGHKGEGTYAKVVAGIEKLKAHPDSAFLFSGLLAVIDPHSSPIAMYQFFKSTGAKSVDFLYRDGNHDKLPFGKTSFFSTEYGEWLTGLSEAYLNDRNPIRIRIVDDCIRLLLGGRGVKEGIGITDFGIVVIDTDGTITKNDTLKSNFAGADRFSEALNVNTHDLLEVFNTSEFGLSHALQRPTSPDCKNCPQLAVCGGGMPLHRWSNSNEYNNPSVYCSDQKHFINHIKKKIHYLIQEKLN